MPPRFSKVRSWIRLGSLLAIVVAMAAGAAPASSSGPTTGLAKPAVPEFVQGELLVKFRPATSQADRDAERGRQQAELRHRFRSGAEHWRLPPGQTTEKALERLRRAPSVQYAEPNYIVTTAILPDDPMFPDQYALRNTGQSGGTPGADVSAEAAWSQTTGSRSVVVAVIDTGVDYKHPDLAQNIYVNPGEIPGNGIDDDHNGFVDDVHGWDFVNNDNDPMDDHFHGTHCAGIIGAVGNNGVGTAGVNWQVSIMPLKFLSAAGSGTTSDAVKAIEYATAMGVNVMSNSWGGGGFSQTLQDAITAAGEHDILFVAAAGNDAMDVGLEQFYPAAFGLPNMLTVAATDRFDALASFSNYSATLVHLGAPGVAILSTLPGGRYGLLSGTSMACPHVAGAAALVLSHFPGSAPPFVKQQLMDGADRIPSLAGLTITGGRLNLRVPLTGGDAVAPAAIDDLTAAPASSNSALLRWTATGNDGRQGNAYRYDLRYSEAPLDEASFPQATPFAGAPSPGATGSPQSAEVTGLLPGTTYYFALKARDAAGNVSTLGNVATATTLPAPTFVSTPSSFEVTLPSGRTTSRTLTISNAGVGTLDWSVQPPALSPNPALSANPAKSGPVLEEEGTAGAGGPDAAGYRYVDSDQPGGPPFAWVDLRVFGLPLMLRGDDSSFEISLPSNMNFYGVEYQSMHVCTNGFLSFTSGETPYQGRPLPNDGAPEALIAPFWDDLIVSDPDASIDYLETDSSFIVQYTNVRRRDGSGPYTFQVEADRSFLDQSGAQRSVDLTFRYLTMSGPVDQASVGIQDATRTIGLQVAYRQPYLHDHLAIRLSTRSQWATVSAASGRLLGGQSQDLTVAFDATGLAGGTYHGGLTVLTNDPRRPAVEHPIQLAVIDGPSLWVSPDVIDFGPLVVGNVAERTFEIRNVGGSPLAIAGSSSDDPAVTSDLGPLTLDPARSRLVTVRAAPTAPGAFLSSLTIASDDPVEPSIVVRLQGTVAPRPSIQLSPGLLEATLQSGGSVIQTVRVSNTGAAPFPFSVAVRDWPAAVGGGTMAGSADLTSAAASMPAPAAPGEPGAAELLPSSPVSLTCLVADPKAGVIYGHEWFGAQFYRFRLSTMTWERLASTPQDTNGGQCITNAILLHNRIYMMNVFGGFLVYDIASDRWTSEPGPVGGYAFLETDGDHTLYLSQTFLMAYDTLTGKSETLPLPPLAQEVGSVRLFEGYLYRDIVIGGSMFMRYDLERRRWEILPPAPQGIVQETAIDPIRREYLAIGYQGFANFSPMVVYRYAIDRGTWSMSPLVPPLIARLSPDLAWLPGPRPAVYVSEGFLDDEAQTRGNAFARIPNGPATAAVAAPAGIAPPGGFVDVPVRLSAAGHDAGVYEPILIVAGTDPGAPVLSIPVRLTVTGTPAVEVLGQPIVAESAADFDVFGAQTQQSLVPEIPPTGGATLELTAIGEYGTFNGKPPATATVSVEGRTLGSTVPLYYVCVFPAVQSFPLSESDLASFLADGRIDVTVKNSAVVGQRCEVNRHLLRLKYDGPTDHLEFGTVFAGGTAARSVRLRNNGTGDLVIATDGADHPEFQTALSTSTVPPGEEAKVEVTFQPVAGGPVAATLTIRTNDASRPEIALTLSGTGAPAPVARVAPPGVDAAILSGDVHTEVVTLSNDGPSPMSFRAGVETTPASGPTATAPGQAEQFESLQPSPEPLSTLIEDPDAGVLYAQAMVGTGFYRYRVGEDRWETLAPSPIAAVTGCGSAFLGGRIYTAYEQEGRIGVYDIASGTWSTLPAPGGDTASSTMGSDGVRYLYFFTWEAEFLRLDPATGQVVNLQHIPEYLYQVDSGDMRAFEGKIYLNQGGGNFVFHRFDVSTGLWKILAQQPKGPVRGMAIDPLARQLYTHGLSNSRNLMRYSIDSDAWSVIEIPTFPIHYGGLAWLPRPHPALYIVQGKIGTGFARLLTEAPFAGVSPAAGVVPSGESVALRTTLSAAHVPEGIVRADLRVDTDDPAHPRLTVPMTMQVTPVPAIVSGTERLDFGSQFVGLSRSLTVRFANRGPAPLQVTISSDLADVSASTAQVAVAPEATAEVAVVFAPRSPGAIDGHLDLATNDPRIPFVRVPMTAEGIAAPHMAVAPEGLDVRLLEGGSETRSLRLTNDGFAALDFSAAVEVPQAACDPSAIVVVERDLGGLEVVDYPDGSARPIAGDLRYAALGLAVDREGAQAFVTDAGSGELVRFDLVTGAKSVVAGGFVVPSGLAVDRNAARAYVSEPGLGRVSAVDLASGSVSTVVTGLSFPSGLALAPGDRFLYVARGDDAVGAVDLIDGSSRTLATNFGYPRALAMHPGGRWLFVLDQLSGRIARVDTQTGDAQTAFCCVDGNAGIAVDPSGALFALQQDRLLRIGDDGAVSSIGEPLTGPAGVALVLPPGCSAGFLSVAPTFGRLDGPGNLDMEIRFDARGLPLGNYETGILFSGNDPFHPGLRVPVTLSVVSNAAPTAVATGGGVVECVDGGGTVSLDGSLSTDPDSTPGTADDIATYQWYEGYGTTAQRLLGSETTLAITLPPGAHALTLLVTDRAGASATATLTATVADTQAPTLSVIAEPAILWPANHELRTVHVQIAAQDRCDATVRVELVSVQSSEPDDAAGKDDGATTGDIQGASVGTADVEILLRAERDGRGPGRIYTLTYRATDQAGNVTPASAIVTVPHDQSTGPAP